MCSALEMQRWRRFLVTFATKATALAAVCLAALLSGTAASAQDREAEGGPQAMVRVAHLAADAPAVDVYVENAPIDALRNKAYGDVSSYADLPARTQSIKVYPSGSTSDPIIETVLSFREGTPYTVGVVGLKKDESLTVQIYEDDTSPPSGDNAKLRVIHASPDVASVDIAPQDGKDLFVGLGYPNASRYAEVPAGTYALEGEPAGTEEQPAFVVPSSSLSSGTVYTAFAVGLANEGTLELILSEDTLSDDRPQVDYLPILARTSSATPEAANSMPETGSVPLATLLVPAAAFVLATALFLATRRCATGARKG